MGEENTILENTYGLKDYNVDHEGVKTMKVI